MLRLSVFNMGKNHSLAKSLQDASPGKFLRKAQLKANMLGKWFLPVDPGIQSNSATAAYHGYQKTWVKESMHVRIAAKCYQETGAQVTSSND